MRPISSRRRRERGLAIIITAFMMMFLVPMVGLGIDVGVLFMLRNKMSAAADAAALGAARGVNVNGNPTQQMNNAKDMAVNFFVANFPDGYLGTSLVASGDGRNVATTFSNPAQIVTISATARVNAPTFFMRSMGLNTVPVSATGTATRRSTNFIMLLDQSGSMASVCTDMKNGAKDFLRLMSRDFDRVSIISYNSTATDLYKPAKNWDPEAFTKIDTISCSGATGSVMALNMGYGQLQAINEQLARNVVVFFTDGLPNATAAYYPVMTQQNVRMSHGMYTDQGSNKGPGPGCTNSQTDCNMWPVLTQTTPAPLIRCTDVNARHLISVTQAGGGTWTGRTQSGAIGRVYNPTTNTYGTVSTSWNSNCSVSDSSDARDVRRAVAYIPPVDYFGNVIYGLNAASASNSTVTPTAGLWDTTISGYGPYGGLRENWMMPDSGTPWVKDATLYNHYFPDGHAYARRMRPDSPSVIYGAGLAALDSQGIRVRQNASLKIKIFSIGYSGNGSIDDIALARLANDGSANDTLAGDNDVYSNPTRTEGGTYVRANNPAQLRAAFTAIASSVLRLAQ